MEGFKLLTVLILLQITGKAFGIQTFYMSDKCGETISIGYKEQIRIKSVHYGSYAPNIRDCEVTISSDILDRMMVYFKSMNIEGPDSNGACNNDYLSIYDGQLQYDSPSTIGKSRFCGYSNPPTVFESSDDYITLKFHSDSSVQSTGFDIIVTQFHEGYCYTWETECSNGKCIDDSLTCNGYNPCGDDSDCKGRTIAIIIGATVGGVVFIAIVIGVVVCVYCMRRRNVGRAGYVARGVPMATTTTSGNMTTNFGSPYSSPPPAYNPNAYGMAGQQNTTTQQYP